MKPMDRIRRAMALRRAHEATEAAASTDERDSRESDAPARHAEEVKPPAEAKRG